jgi:hypothetical protein
MSYPQMFNNILGSLMEQIVERFPTNVDLLLAQKTTEQFRKINPVLLIKVWYSLVTIPYEEYILTGNIDYFLNKDYTEDISKLQNIQQLGMSNDKILNIIDGLRTPIRSMAPEEKKKYTDMIIQLTKLSKLYTQSKLGGSQK